MKSLFLALFAISAVAAPLPPMPDGIKMVVATKEPTILRSPRDASQPKSTPMAKTGSGFFPAASEPSEPQGTMTYKVVKNLNFFGCDTNDPGCQLYDYEEVEELAPAGVALQFELSDVIEAPFGAVVAQFYPPTVDTYVGFSRYYTVDQRPQKRFYRARAYTPDGFTPAGLVQTKEPWKDPKIPLARVWTRPVK